MTIKVFQQLSIEERAPVIAEHGILIGQLVHKGKGYRIMSLFKFYVEFIYNDVNFTSIHSIKSFEGGDSLDKYSAGLEDLLK